MFRGHKVQAGRWDMYHVLADLHGWTPEEVDRMPMDFVLDHLARERARQDVERARQKRGDEAALSEIELSEID